MRILVLGYVVRAPIAGMCWHYLNYVLGLARLGHDVWFLEDSEDFASCYDPSRHVTTEDPTYGLGWTTRTFNALGLGERWAYYDAHRTAWDGPAAGRIAGITGGAEALVNVSGANPLRPWLREIPLRIFIDTDPAFEQIRQLTEEGRKERTAQHNAHFSFGESLGDDGAPIPDDGWTWRPTRQPVVLDSWPCNPGPADGHFTSVLQWDSYPERTYAGLTYGMKSRSFKPFLDLPKYTPEVLELALGSPSAPRDKLRARGWRLRDPLEVTRDIHTYQRYLGESKGEFSIAKHGYVVGRTGWFSERSACYLASGRPVVAQDTGFSSHLPTGEGLLAFNTPEEAVSAMATISAAYPRHCAAAREVAEVHFDARRVLTKLLEDATAVD